MLEVNQVAFSAPSQCRIGAKADVNMDISPLLLMDGHRVDFGIGSPLLHRLGHELRGLPLVNLGFAWKLESKKPSTLSARGRNP